MVVGIHPSLKEQSETAVSFAKRLISASFSEDHRIRGVDSSGCTTESVVAEKAYTGTPVPVACTDH